MLHELFYLVSVQLHYTIGDLFKLLEFEKEIEDTYLKILSFLQVDKINNSSIDDSLKTTFESLYISMEKYIADIRSENIRIKDKSKLSNMAKDLNNKRNLFLKEKDQYLHILHEKLNRALFQNISLEEIRDDWKF